MDLVLCGLHWEQCLVYVDDIIVHGRTFEEYLDKLHLVWSRLREANLKMKPSKCKLFQDSVTFLGHVVSRDGVRCDPKKIAVQERLIDYIKVLRDINTKRVIQCQNR